MPATADVPQQKCPRCGTALNVGEIEPLARVECPSCGEKFRVERSFDNFVIVESLGVGGMGSVYKARDTRLERFVALKLLRKELSADPEEAARLEQEARMTAAVNHPNVIQVYSSGTDHGQIYLVMELVDHGSLDDLMAQHKRVPEVQVLRAGIQVARGLQAAHERGLIHRDVKPANILFSDANTAKIGDFGLAGAAEDTGSARKEIWGTPYYVAPERLNSEPEDFRSDIYSLGATLFHALAGKPPIEGETTSASELRQLKSRSPDLRAVAPEVQRETARVIERMLAPQPQARFKSYAELLAEMLRAYGVASGTTKRSRGRWLAMAVSALLVAGAIGAVVYWTKTRQSPPAAITDLTPKPTAAPENIADLQRRFDDARRLLIDGKYDQASTAFAKLSSDARDRQPLLNWTRLHNGLAALLQKKIGPARDAFAQIDRAGPFSTAKNDAELANFFVETSRMLAASGPVRESALGEVNLKSVSALALFLSGIKNWQLGEFGEGAALLRKFETTDPPNEFKWINDYKPMARKFVIDYALYEEWKKLPQQLNSAAEAKTTTEKLRDLQRRAQIRGALVDALREDQTRLSRRAAELEKNERETRERAAAEQFKARKDEWLNAWRTRLIADLQTGAYRGPIKMGATDYQGVAGANDREITLRIAPYGSAPYTWDKFTPENLLTMARAFIRPGTPDAADRQWLSAIYAQSTGQTDAARELGEEAAKAKPEYRDNVKLLLGGG